MDQSHEPPSAAKGPFPGELSPAEGAGAFFLDREDARFKGGTIELRSGVWKWTAHVDDKGSAIILHDEKSPNNRMRVWLAAAAATQDEVMRAGREPEVRWWENSVGIVWEIRVEETFFPPTLEQRSRRRRRIVFEQGGHRLGTELPEGRTLGELTLAELTALLYESA